jgi:hypothetical protein
MSPSPKDAVYHGAGGLYITFMSALLLRYESRLMRVEMLDCHYGWQAAGHLSIVDPNPRSGVMYRCRSQSEVDSAKIEHRICESPASDLVPIDLWYSVGFLVILASRVVAWVLLGLRGPIGFHGFHVIYLTH